MASKKNATLDHDDDDDDDDDDDHDHDHACSNFRANLQKMWCQPCPKENNHTSCIYHRGHEKLPNFPTFPPCLMELAEHVEASSGHKEQKHGKNDTSTTLLLVKCIINGLFWF